MTSQKIILDTDIGTDIDDAICLAYLLEQPECEILGITTVTGEANKRAMLASALCKAANKNIPIFPGSEKPLVINQRQRKAQQSVALQNWDHETRFPQKQAIEFMQQTIRSHPKEITLLAIGPLTNIGHLFKIDPEIPSLLKGMTLMCGRFSKPSIFYFSEWNAKLDPHATSIVYNSEISTHRSIGIDVTQKTMMSAKNFKQLYKSNLSTVVLDFARTWFQVRPFVIFHDPLAATTLFNDEVCSFKKGIVTVETGEKNHSVYGKTRFYDDENGKHEVAVTINKTIFLNTLFGISNKNEIQ